MQILKRITGLRNERGWTNNRMAMEAGISSATVTNWYTRNVSPSLEMITALCVAFEISLSDFFNENKEHRVLTPFQNELLHEIGQFGKDERADLLRYIKTSNNTRKQYS